VIMMSATMAVGSDWDYIERWTGLAGESRRVRFDAGSPFDFASQALLFVPGKDVKEPSGANRQIASAWAQEATSDLVRGAGGGALLLFTSRAEMDRSYAALAPRFIKAGLACMKQGEAAPGELKKAFAEDGNAVLWGLRTFMEGIDIQGMALRLVVMDKLPFAVPSDLLFAARCEQIDARATRWADKSFSRLSIPMMSLVLIQAFGRLIRHRDDRGVVAILDSRLSTKGYGKVILDSLPPAPRTTDLAEAISFLSESRA
jgi:ATP-dependent DNA helicase DinG